MGWGGWDDKEGVGWGGVSKWQYVCHSMDGLYT